MSAGFAVPVTEKSQVAEARRQAAALGRQAGFDEAVAGRLAVTVTEAATNLVKHAGGGEIILRPLPDGDRWVGVEMLALDSGPGMADVAACLRDGYSTAGSLGTGLGAMQRQADWFGLYSAPGLGTAVAARLWAAEAAKVKALAERVQLGAVNLAKRGEEESGDAWAWRETANGLQMIIADGLGHGPLAADAAREAIRVFEASGGQSPGEIVTASHFALRSTRGAALAVVQVDVRERRVTYCGLGNTVAVIFSPTGTQHMISHNGTAGHEAGRIHEFNYPWPASALLVLYSDGLQSQVKLTPYAGLSGKHPCLIAGVLYRDFKRGRDDETVIVVSMSEAPL